MYNFEECDQRILPVKVVSAIAKSEFLLNEEALQALQGFNHKN
jgi:hypothetical protein